MRPLSLIALSLSCAIALAPAAHAADAKRGKRIVKRCTVCHSLVAGKKKIGPSLYAVVGRKAGTMKGYRYSPAMRAASAKGLVWSKDNLAGYLSNPKKYLAKVNGKTMSNKMPFKLTKAKDRGDAIAFLETVK